MKRFKIILVALVAATMIQAVPITANAKQTMILQNQ